MKTFPQDLIDAFNSDEVVGIVGSGPSVSAGFPTWESLLELMVAECDKQLVGFKQAKELRTLLKRGHLLEVADECSRLLDGQLYRDFIQRTFRQESVRPAQLHALIAGLPFSGLLTTNYDNLLERAYLQQQGMDAYPLVFTRRNAAQLPRLSTERRFFIFKVHGDVDDLESIVLTKRDYHEIVHNNEVYRTALSQILATRTALFIGYGLRDYDLNLVLAEQAALFKAYGRRHYAFLADPGTVLPKSFLEHYNITVLPYAKRNRHQELQSQIDDLTKQVKTRHRVNGTDEARKMRQLIQVEREFCKKLGTFVERERAHFLKLHASEALEQADRDLIERSIEYWNTRDSTQLRLEAQLRQSQKMEGIGQLAAGIAHDFNNLLCIVQGYTRMLNERLRGEEADFVRQIEMAADRAASLTRQLLTFARKTVSQPCATDINELINDLSKMLSRLIGENIRLDLKLSPKVGHIMADRGMLEQALLNLVVNARDAMSEGGRLTIKTDFVEISSDNLSKNPEARLGRCVCTSISDTGCGMTQDVLSRIFEPFFTTKEAGKGTGLGLSVVYGIVKQHNGWIEVRSEAGKGTMFELFLPEGAPKNPSTQSMRQERLLHGNETILIVEDEPSLRDLAARILREFGYKIFEASDGPEALKVWEAHSNKIDLLFTDMVMPNGMSGLDLSLALVKKQPALRVVYTSGYRVDLATKTQFAENFITKPYKPHALLNIIRTVLDTSKSL